MTELKFNRCGNYPIPDMGLSDEEWIPPGRYGLIRATI